MNLREAGGHTTIITVNAQKDETGLVLQWHEYPDERTRKRRFGLAKANKDQLTHIDGDYMLTIIATFVTPEEWVAQEAILQSITLEQ